MTGTLTVAMPRLGVSMTEGTIVQWRKSVGDEIDEGETLLVVETAKVEVEVPCPVRGVIEELLAHEGQVVPILEPIARIRLT